jgi:hypothetical protein
MLDGKLIFLLVLLWDVSPIAVHMPVEKLGRQLLGFRQGTQGPGVATTLPNEKRITSPPLADACAGGRLPTLPRSYFQRPALGAQVHAREAH